MRAQEGLAVVVFVFLVEQHGMRGRGRGRPGRRGRRRLSRESSIWEIQTAWLMQCRQTSDIFD